MPRARHLVPAVALALAVLAPSLEAANQPTATGPKPPIGTEKRARLRDLGIVVGKYAPGKHNAITDVAGVKVGHATVIKGSGKLTPGQGPARTGVTVILPTSDDFYHTKVPAGSHVFNGNGEFTGFHFVQEFGFLETPIVYGDTLGLGRNYDGIISYMLRRFPTIGVGDFVINPIVGETDNTLLNDVQGRHVRPEDVVAAAENASTGPVAEGSVGGGTGMTCYGFKCGIGTASRVVPAKVGGYTVGAIVQANFGRREELTINGVPVGQEITELPTVPSFPSEGSLLVTLASDAPLTARQLNRLARRVALGMGRTGTTGRSGSGDLFLAFATGNRYPEESIDGVYPIKELDEGRINPLFRAAEEATEEAILNSMTMAQTVYGRDDHVAHAIPLARLTEVMKKYKKAL